MTHVLGAGDAGGAAIRSCEAELVDSDDLMRVARERYHLVLHEAHRVIRNPSV